MITDMEREIAETEAKTKAKKEMASHGAIQAGHGPVVQYENVGGGANHKIDGRNETVSSAEFWNRICKSCVHHAELAITP